MLRKTLARLFAPLAFLGRGRSAATYAAFARAEEGSRRDLLLAAAATESAERAALYLRHAEDEARHARVFARVSRRLDREAGRDGARRFDADVEALFARLGEIGFIAFAYRGEHRGRTQFEAYRDHFAARGDDESARMFEEILADELRHERYTRELLDTLCGSATNSRRALRRSAVWEAGRTFRRTGRKTAEILWRIAATALYVASAPLSLLTRIVRPERSGFLPPES